MPLHWLFPTPVMQVDLTPDDGIAAAMHQQLEVFDRDMFGDPQFSNRNNLTGDLQGLLDWISCIGWMHIGSISRSQSRCCFI